jgi:hypothetical protein
MEERYRELTVQLEGFKAIEDERNALARAITVLKGERLTKASTGQATESIESLLRQAPDGLTLQELQRALGVKASQTVNNRIDKLISGGVPIITITEARNGLAVKVFRLSDAPVERESHVNGRNLTSTEVLKGFLMANRGGVTKQQMRDELRHAGYKSEQVADSALQGLKRSGARIIKKKFGDEAIYRLGK